MERRGRESVKFYGDHHDCPKETGQNYFDGLFAGITVCRRQSRMEPATKKGRQDRKKCFTN
jgi:hypothetical protein